MVLRRKPLIGITTFLKPYVTELGQRREEVLDRSYVDMIAAAGAASVLLPTLNPEDVDQVTSSVDGIILSGGDDDIARDRFESKLIQNACKKTMPILGICRGAQILNVTLGGTLRKDIEGHCLANGGMKVHRIDISSGSTSASILASAKARVACWHHYAVDRIASDLRVSGISDDGIVEILEHASLPVIGVQWHPELLPESNEAQRTVRWLVSAAERWRGQQ